MRSRKTKAETMWWMKLNRNDLNIMLTPFDCLVGGPGEHFKDKSELIEALKYLGKKYKVDCSEKIAYVEENGI